MALVPYQAANQGLHLPKQITQFILHNQRNWEDLQHRLGVSRVIQDDGLRRRNLLEIENQPVPNYVIRNDQQYNILKLLLLLHINLQLHMK
jgi:hypothetical protein